MIHLENSGFGNIFALTWVVVPKKKYSCLGLIFANTYDGVFLVNAHV